MGKHKNTSHKFEGYGIKTFFGPRLALILGILAAINLLIFFVFNKTAAILVFALIGLLTSLFSKNISIILLVAMIGTNLLMTNSRVREGLTNGTGDDIVAGDDKDESSIVGVGNVDGGAPKPIIDKIKDKFGKQKKDDFESDQSDDTLPTPVMSDSSAQSSSVDKNATTEDAYENLESMLGSGGLKNLNTETTSIMKSQEKMMETMKTMQPLIKQANSLLNAVNNIKL